VRQRATAATGLVVLVLALAAFGLAAGSGGAVSFDPVPSTLGEALPLLLVSCAWVLAATLVLARASSTGDHRPAVGRAMKVNLAMLVVAALLVMSAWSPPSTLEPPRAAPRLIQSDRWNGWLDMGWITPLLLAVFVPLALIGLVLLAGTAWSVRGRFFSHRAQVVRERRFGGGRRDSAQPEDVLDVIVRARRALQSDEDARRAIVAAYAAMERAVAAHGVQRELSQTPAEFLAEAFKAGLLRDRAAAGQLRRLFELARFSHQPLPSGARADVDAGLGALQAELAQSDLTQPNLRQPALPQREPGR
jgi:hypothetical protein